MSEKQHVAKGEKYAVGQCFSQFKNGRFGGAETNNPACFAADGIASVVRGFVYFSSNFFFSFKLSDAFPTKASNSPGSDFHALEASS